jgi:HAD superfamily hydrolase (TIGR01509 family)
VIKPDPGILRAALGAMSVGPGQTLFVDDNARNVRAAQRLGFVRTATNGSMH